MASSPLRCLEARQLNARRGGGPDGEAGEPALWSTGRPRGLPTRPAVVCAHSHQCGSPNPVAVGGKSGLDYIDGGCFQRPILCTGRPGSTGLARTAQPGPMPAASDVRPNTSGPLLHAVLLQTAERRSFRCVYGSQTFDLDSPRATRHRQTVAHGPQRPEHGPKTSDTSDL